MSSGRWSSIDAFTPGCFAPDFMMLAFPSLEMLSCGSKNHLGPIKPTLRRGHVALISLLLTVFCILAIKSRIHLSAARLQPTYPTAKIHPKDVI